MENKTIVKKMQKKTSVNNNGYRSNKDKKKPKRNYYSGEYDLPWYCYSNPFDFD